MHARQPQLPSRERLRSIQRFPPRDTRPGSCGKRLPGATLRPLQEYPPLRAAFPSPAPTATSSTGSSHASDHFPRALLQPIVLRNHPVSSGYSSYPRSPTRDLSHGPGSRNTAAPASSATVFARDPRCNSDANDSASASQARIVCIFLRASRVRASLASLGMHRSFNRSPIHASNSFSGSRASNAP